MAKVLLEMSLSLDAQVGHPTRTVIAQHVDLPTPVSDHLLTGALAVRASSLGRSPKVSRA